MIERTSTKMNSPRVVLLFACALLAVAPVRAQSVSARTDAAALARFDANQNGRLDPDELAAQQAAETTAARAVRAAAPSDSTMGETVQLSPFEVVADTKGYFSANTMSGTRLNSKLEDIGAAITVMTKEQMADFAMLDINDIFLYSVGTEKPLPDPIPLKIQSPISKADPVRLPPFGCRVRLPRLGSVGLVVGGLPMPLGNH